MCSVIKEFQINRTVNIGRSPANDLVFNAPTISRLHARINIIYSHGYAITDLNSTNGTFVNGKRIVRTTNLHDGDSIKIGPINLIINSNKLTIVDNSFEINLDAYHINQQIGTKKLLSDISFSIKAHEFVAIVGPSGAGKSTLLNALCGFKPAMDGHILLNSTDLYTNFDLFREQIGYVPQNNITHSELHVDEALTYAARLRLPMDTNNNERSNRISEVLDSLGLKNCSHRQIKSLSGGEQKRVSIAAELLTKPGIIFLDEVTSGLDPATEKLIMQILRGLANVGHTIIIVTHATNNIALCDEVAILTRRGYLAYFGPPGQALIYFKVKNFDEIYNILEKNSPENWSVLYQKSFDFLKYVKSRQIQLFSAITQRRKLSKSSKNNYSSLLQFCVLSLRNINLIIRDKPNLILLLSLPFAIGMLDFIFWRKGLLDPINGDSRVVLTNLFMVSIICCLVGALSSMREIVKEIDIYRRERMVAVKTLPYAFSKLVVPIIFSAYSAFIFIAFMKLAGDWPATEQQFNVFLTLLISTLSGCTLGLLISSLSPNQNTTPLLLLLVLVPQLLFGGIIPQMQLGSIGRIIGYATATKWTFESLVSQSGMGIAISQDPYWELDEDIRQSLTEQEKEAISTTLGTKIFSQSNFPGIQKYYDTTVDSFEPQKPISPGAAPQQPGEPPPMPKNLYDTKIIQSWQKQMDTWESQMNKYKIDLEKYRSSMNEYQSKMGIWQVDYQNWKEKRSEAIGEAEGIVKNMYEDYGYAFNVDVGSHSETIICLSAIYLILTVLCLKIKDKQY